MGDWGRGEITKVKKKTKKSRKEICTNATPLRKQNKTKIQHRIRARIWRVIRRSLPPATGEAISSALFSSWKRGEERRRGESKVKTRAVPRKTGNVLLDGLALTC
jgi:hypothetical protein